MIKVNTRDHAWHEGLTARGLLDEEQFIFRHIIVRVNGEYVAEDDYAKAVIADGDDVMVLHLIAGG